jgi:hypothetical protein
VTANAKFEVSIADDFPGEDLDLVTFFDCLHDMGDPVGAARHVRQTLKPDGSWMIVEPAAGDRLEDNLNPVSRMYYAGSTMICVPTSLDQPVGAAFGAQAGFARLSSAISQGGFSNVRKAIGGAGIVTLHAAGAKHRRLRNCPATASRPPHGKRDSALLNLYAVLLGVRSRLFDGAGMKVVADERRSNAGMRWGAICVVGAIPLAVLAFAARRLVAKRATNRYE